MRGFIHRISVSGQRILPSTIPDPFPNPSTFALYCPRIPSDSNLACSSSRSAYNNKKCAESLEWRIDSIASGPPDQAPPISRDLVDGFRLWVDGSTMGGWIDCLK